MYYAASLLRSTITWLSATARRLATFVTTFAVLLMGLASIVIKTRPLMQVPFEVVAWEVILPSGCPLALLVL